MNRFHRTFPLRAVVVAAALLTAASAMASARPEAQPAQPAQPAYPGYGPGAMRGGMRTPGGMGPGMTGRGGMRGDGRWDGPGMSRDQWGGRGWQSQQAPLLDKPLTLDGAVERVQAAIKERGYQDELVVDDVLQYSWSFYVLVKEKSTGKGAVELLVDPRTGVVTFEGGPGMMWNTKYGRTRWSSAPAAAVISADEAKKAASDWLAQNGDTVKWDMQVKELYGYYTIRLVRDGRVEGILSVNASTRAVWYHRSYGPFVAAKRM